MGCKRRILKLSGLLKMKKFNFPNIQIASVYYGITDAAMNSELGQILGDAEGQGGLACCSLWGQKESDMTGPLNNRKQVTKENILHSIRSST